MQLMDLLNCNAVKCCDKENHIKSKIGFHGKVTYPMFPCHTLSLKKVVKLVTEAFDGIRNISKRLLYHGKAAMKKKIFQFESKKDFLV